MVLCFCGSRLEIRFFSMKSISGIVFGVPGGGSFGAVASGFGDGGGVAGAGGGSGAAVSVTASSGAAVRARHTRSYSKVM